MAGPRIRPLGTEFWPARAVGLSLPELIRTYEDGFCGAYSEPEEAEQLASDITAAGGKVFGADIATENGFADSGDGKLSVPYVFAMIHFPNCLPGPAQDRGDCVSHCEKNANLGSYACEIQDAKPDEVTGKVEEAPQISAKGMKEGAFSTEVFYWFRRHGGDGWSCDASARVAMKEAGLVTRENHPELETDLTEYSGRNAGKYGRTPPSGAVAEALDNNLVRQATTLNSREERRDFIHNGYSISTCGSEGFSDKRDENGASKRSGSWAHAMAFIGFDDRASTKNLYDGDSLELVQNSWAVWNGGPRDIRDSKQFVRSLCLMVGRTVPELVALDIVNGETLNLMIPKGSFWSRSRDVSRRSCIAKGGVNGWPKRELWLPGPYDGVI